MLLLSYAAEGTDFAVEVLELVVDAPLPPDTFMWDGPVSPPPPHRLRSPRPR
ncbi:MAG: hypothetical protein M3P48_02070 [Actinomycetota bacterium]|nr:hypothetical protein [Actinomycetota bacterium]